LNDHHLKGRGPDAITGKLSDVAGLFMFPLVVVAALEVARWGLRHDWRATPRSFVIVAAAVGCAFASIKLVTEVGDAYQSGLGALRWAMLAPFDLVTTGRSGTPGRVSLVSDPADLWALPALLGSVAVGFKCRPSLPKSGGRRQSAHTGRSE